MRANAETINAMALLVQTQYRLLVDVVRCDDRQLPKPRDRKVLRHLLERVARQHRQICQITRIDANADGPIALIVQRQRDGAEVQQAAPVTSLGWR